MNNDPTDSIESAFINLIRIRLGIVIHRHQTNDLNKTIREACGKFNCNAEEYLQLLRNSSEDSPLFEHVIAGITVSETYFFRDKNQMELLRQTILPQLIKSKREQNDLSLRIWSAGCATGEEIYTLGMMLLELLPDMDAWRLQLLGTDLNTRSLQKAIVGHYTEWAMRSISNYYKQHYFICEKKNYILAERIRDLVNFSYLNLNDDTYPSLFNSTNAQDLILCRNVLIYFDNARINRVMKKLSDSLVPGGWLLLGASDPILTDNTELVFHHRLGIVFSRPTLDELLVLPAVTAEKLPKMPVARSATKMPPRPIPPPPAKKPDAVLTPDQQSITELLNENRWQDAITAIHVSEKSGVKNSTLLNSKALAYANLGQLDKSLQACLDSLSLDTTNKYTYFNFALTLTELNRLNEAETAFRKTLFLDHHFVVGHFQLGLLLLKKKQHEMGMKSLNNALTIAEAKNSSEPVPGYQGLNYGKLSEIFRHEIEMYAAMGGMNRVNQTSKK